MRCIKPRSDLAQWRGNAVSGHDFWEGTGCSIVLFGTAGPPGAERVPPNLTSVDLNGLPPLALGARLPIWKQLAFGIARNQDRRPPARGFEQDDQRKK
jgi:hypothetical protein